MSFLRPKMPPQAPIKYPDPPPTIDQASVQSEAADRLRRRRGRASYVFGGNQLSPVSVSSKTLTGQ